MTFRLPSTLKEIDEELLLVRAQLRKMSLKRFIVDAYPLLKTGTDLKWAPYLDAICEHLQALITGDIKRLIINVRNRSLKSSIASVCLNPWAWLTQPHLRFFTGGHDKRLAEEHCWSSRLLIRSAWYQRMIDAQDRWILNENTKPDPAWGLADDQDQKSFFANTRGGRRISAQTGSGTGKGGHIFVIDDPLSVDQSYSSTETETANRWVLHTVMRGFDDPDNARMAVIQHRLRPDDTSGELLRLDLGFESLVLPFEFDPKRIMPITSLGWEDPRTEPGETLCPGRWSEKQVELDKIQFGDLFQAICNQNPSKRGSQLVKPEWFRYWGKDHPLPASFRLVESWDLSTKGLDPTTPAQRGRKRSKTGGIVAAMTESGCYLQDMVNEHADYIEQKALVRRVWDRWGRHTPFGYVEDQSNGSALILELTHGTEGQPGIPGVIGVNPQRKGGKYQRLAAIAHFIHAGNVYLPDPDSFPWVREFVRLVCDFPNAENDEIPDVLSQLLSEEWLTNELGAPGEESAEQRAQALVQIYG